ncbi:MAG: hypothetical protein Q9170_007271 [Blastenia crenularia]
MLQALMIASGSYLGVPLAEADVVFPSGASEKLIKTLRATSSILGIHLPLSRPYQAGILAAHAYGLIGDFDGTCSDEQLILTVDYSRAALTASLIYDDCGITEIDGRILHDINFGADALSNSSEQVRAEMVLALRSLTTLPLHHCNGEGVTEISALVFTGESAGNTELQDILKEALGEHSGRLLKGASDRLNGPVDPLFVTSREVAKYCWQSLELLATREWKYDMWVPKRP